MVNTTLETMDFLKSEHRQNDLSWGRLCLALARTARGIGPVYPSALAAMHATPAAHRIGWNGVRKGHVGYFDDPNDSNEFAHIATCAGRTKDGRRLWWTNDAKRSGGVDLVADPSPNTSWFAAHWGDGFVHAADWLNGVNFEDYVGGGHGGSGGGGGGGHPQPPKPDPDPRSHVEQAVRQLRQAEEQARDNHKPKRGDRIHADIRYLIRRYNLREN